MPTLTDRHDLRVRARRVVRAEPGARPPAYRRRPGMAPLPLRPPDSPAPDGAGATPLTPSDPPGEGVA